MQQLGSQAIWIQGRIFTYELSLPTDIRSKNHYCLHRFLCGHFLRSWEVIWFNKPLVTYLLSAHKSLRGIFIPPINIQNSKTKSACIKLNRPRGSFFNPSDCGSQGAVFSPLWFIFFSSDYLEHYETKWRYADGSTSLCSPFESVTQYETPEKNQISWRLVKNSTEIAQRLFNTAELKVRQKSIYGCYGWCSNRPTIEVKKTCWPPAAFNLFNWINFNCIMDWRIRPTSRLELFTVYNKYKIVCDFCLRFDSNPSSLDGLWWNVVKTVISPHCNRFHKHIAFALHNLLTPRKVF